MEKTPEQKQAARERYLEQLNKATEMLDTDSLDKYIDALKYAYSLSIRYRKNLRSIVDSVFENPFKEVGSPLSPKEKCIKAGILTPWRDTYWFDKEKAESLQLWIQEHTK